MDNGNIDAFGYSTVLSGYLLVGWIDFGWRDPAAELSATLNGQDGVAEGSILVAQFPREDVARRGRGVIAFLQTSSNLKGQLLSLNIKDGVNTFNLFMSEPCTEYPEEDLAEFIRGFVAKTAHTALRSKLKLILDRPKYQGEDTLGGVAPHVHLAVDQIFFCPPRGFIFIGWFLDPLSEVSRMRFRSGTAAVEFGTATWVVVRRPDVIQAFSHQYALAQDDVGYIAFAPDILHTNEDLYIEIEMNDGRIAFRKMQSGFLTGLPAIRDVLARFKVASDELDGAFDNVVGPAVASMNAHRLRAQPDEKVLLYGEPVQRPSASIIVPLYGRMDFLEYQLAYFSQESKRDFEVIYVLDDPDRRSELEALAAACYTKFEISFTLVVLSHNVGYAPANNIGLRHAQGEHVCFLNSDVFPAETGWLDQLIATQKSARNIGIVGALLIYEDEAIQHRGCTFERLPEFGHWMFVKHPDKGRRVALPAEVQPASAVTGACMVMRRDLANRLNGFDEDYVIGDFEDADLCLRARELGLICVVDYRARLYHLERQSQGQVQPWRMNLTLYNAWRFQRRWAQNEL